MRPSDYLDNLGKKATDKFTGFTGHITGVIFYVSGCTQYLVAPSWIEKEGKCGDNYYFDVQRCEVSDDDAVVLGKGPDGPDTPGRNSNAVR